MVHESNGNPRLAIPAPAGILLAMTPRPWYRSRLFWLGMPGLVFLLWGWWMSMRHLSGGGYLGAIPWVIAQGGGELCAWWDSDGSPDQANFGVFHAELPPERAGRWRRNMVGMGNSKPTRHFVAIPYHWVVLAYAVTWLLTLTCWQRRKSRLMKLHAAP